MNSIKSLEKTPELAPENRPQFGKFLPAPYISKSDNGNVNYDFKNRDLVCCVIATQLKIMLSNLKSFINNNN